MFSHEDRLKGLNGDMTLGRKLGLLHAEIARRFPFVVRVAVAVFDPKRKTLKTFISSGERPPELSRYEARLEDAPSLVAILKSGRPRVVNDLRLFAEGTHEHTKAIARLGYGASYTTPMEVNGDFLGFVFMNSVATGSFTEDVLAELDVFAHLAASMVASEVLVARILVAAVGTAHSMVHLRDPETGAHLDRMAEFSRVIAQDLASRGRADLDDEAIERLHLFAPLHDLGKIGIPDRVLLKGSALTPAEREEMKAHCEKGREMIARIADNFGLDHLSAVEVLKAIAAAHHEAPDGSGYPRGIRREEIPLEARIVAVADVFDALTSRRSYKEPWSNDDAFAFLVRLAPEKLDADCVDALVRNRGRILDIQRCFRESPDGHSQGAPLSSLLQASQR
jgi:HD-GYP domain-containing protein (c-di-GMP phosphodiesterase class II)